MSIWLARKLRKGKCCPRVKVQIAELGFSPRFLILHPRPFLLKYHASQYNIRNIRRRRKAVTHPFSLFETEQIEIPHLGLI